MTADLLVRSAQRWIEITLHIVRVHVSYNNIQLKRVTFGATIYLTHSHTITQ